MGQDELLVTIDKVKVHLLAAFGIVEAHWPKNVLRVLMPALRKLGDSHGHIIVAPQPARGVILLQGAAKHLEAAKPGLRALIEEHFPDADVPRELLKPEELPAEPEAEAAEPEVAAPEQTEAEPPVEKMEVDSPQVLAAKALRRAYATHSASAMRIALGAAYSAGVDRETLEEGERCLKELTAAAALGVALAGEVSIQELQTLLMAAREAGVGESKLEEAELKLGRLETAKVLMQAMSASEAELREALAGARAMAVEPQLLAEAEARLCTLAAESELLSAMELVKTLERGEVDEETEVVFAAAVREAEAARVSASLLAEADAWLGRMAAQREAQLSQKRASHEDESKPSKRPKTQQAEDGAENKQPSVDGDSLKEWACCLIESSLLMCCKRKAIEAEDFDQALELKQLEQAVGDRLQKAKTKCQQSPMEAMDRPLRLEEVRRQKQEAVAREDYDRAMELKELEKQLESQRQLEGVHANAAALRIISDCCPEELSSPFQPALRQQLEAAPELWQLVAMDLKGR